MSTAQGKVTISFDDLDQKQIWTPATGSNIAPNPPDASKILYEPDGIRLYTLSTLQYAGWMARTSLALPPLPPQFTALLSLDVNCDDGVTASLQALELDSMFAMADGRVGNTSFEYNQHSGGHAQIVDTNYKWSDIGFNPGPLPIDTWTNYQFLYSFDQVAGLSSVQSVSIAGTLFSVPTTKQNIPFQNLKWDKNRWVIQLQSNMVQSGGACSFKVRSIKASLMYNL